MRANPTYPTDWRKREAHPSSKKKKKKWIKEITQDIQNTLDIPDLSIREEGNDLVIRIGDEEVLRQYYKGQRPAQILRFLWLHPHPKDSYLSRLLKRGGFLENPVYPKRWGKFEQHVGQKFKHKIGPYTEIYQIEYIDPYYAQSRGDRSISFRLIAPARSYSVRRMPLGKFIRNWKNGYFELYKENPIYPKRWKRPKQFNEKALLQFIRSRPSGSRIKNQYDSIRKNLVTKMARGIFDLTQSVKLFGYLVESAAKFHARDMSAPSPLWFHVYPPKMRRKIAQVLAVEFEEEARRGDWDHLLPKKYQKNPIYPKKWYSSIPVIGTEYEFLEDLHPLQKAVWHTYYVSEIDPADNAIWFTSDVSVPGPPLKRWFYPDMLIEFMQKGYIRRKR